MPAPARMTRRPRGAFTLIELLVVISIISLLISILLPSLSRARDQAKGVHCLARLKDFGNSMAAYENISNGVLPPARWHPAEIDLDRTGNSGLPVADLPGPDEVAYGWAEILFAYVYHEPVRLPDHFPVQRNLDGRRWQEYFLCRAVGETGSSSGHYRVYLPAWSAGSYSLMVGGVYGNESHADPQRPARREGIRPKLPLIGDANVFSERGDGFGDDDGSYIDAAEANYAGSDGRNGNRFDDRHYGGTNYLFQDLHASWSTSLRRELARDYDFNGVLDIAEVPP